MCWRFIGGRFRLLDGKGMGWEERLNLSFFLAFFRKEEKRAEMLSGRYEDFIPCLETITEVRERELYIPSSFSWTVVREGESGHRRKETSAFE